VNEGEVCSIQHLGKYAFQIQRNLIDQLAMTYNAQAILLFWHVNQRHTAAYSGCLVLPIFPVVRDFARYMGVKTVKLPSKIFVMPVKS